MTARTWNAMLSRSTLAGLAAISLVACGSREPTTDAERLARGRELVQTDEHTARRGERDERDDHRNARGGASVRQERDGVANGLCIPCDAPIVSTRR